MKKLVIILTLFILSGCVSNNPTKEYTNTPLLVPTLANSIIGKSIHPIMAFALLGESSSKIALLNNDCSIFTEVCIGDIDVLPFIAQVGMVSNPIWSNDGDTLMFISNNTGNQDVVISRDDGTNVINISHSDEREECPIWLMDDRHIIFSREKEDGGNISNQIMISDRVGSNIHYVTNGYCATLSPDGNNILFTDRYNDKSVLYTLSIANFIKGQGDTKPASLTDPSLDVYCPSYSFDGKHIAFLVLEENKYFLRIMNNDGTNMESFYEINIIPGCPIWGPDNTSLVFTGSKSNIDQSDIYIFNFITMGLLNITNSPDTSDNNPAWSHNGKYIAYDSKRNIGYSDIYLYILNENRTIRITNASIEAEYFFPSWRPITEN